MQNVQVFHVGQPIPMTISDADFHTEQEGDLVVNRGAEVVAQFPAGKWSAVIKMDAPTTTTSASRAAAHTYTAACAGHHGLNEKCP